MLGFLNLVILIGLQFFFVECLIPTQLTVQKLDSKLIQRKRQDTLEMCRLFEAENERLRKLESNSLLVKSVNFRRSKREIESINPVLDTEIRREDDHHRSKRTLDFFGNPELSAKDRHKVENLVDKMYDDLAENGERVKYRKKAIVNKTTTTVVTKAIPMNQMSGRRFDFAPELLLGPNRVPQKNKIIDKGDTRIPWKKHWKHGIIPYFIDPSTYDSHLAEVIRKAFDYFEKATCIRLQRLREKPTDKESLQNVEWVYITNPNGIRQCVHSNERKPNKGVQIVVFGYDCLSLGEIVHEVMHILGYSHEHTRPDRDKYISILWDNIKPGYRKYFELRNEDFLMNLPYDYASVLHYPQRAFSRNGQVTLRVETGKKVGQREGLSEIDAEKVSMIYGIDCVERNKQYLLTTCPAVIKSKKSGRKNATQNEIENYFKNRVWPYGIINYKWRDVIEFSTEERENIKAVIRHIERETCIEFRNLATDEEEDAAEDKKVTKDKPKGKKDNTQTTQAHLLNEKVKDEPVKMNLADSEVKIDKDEPSVLSAGEDNAKKSAENNAGPMIMSADEGANEIEGKSSTLVETATNINEGDTVAQNDATSPAVEPTETEVPSVNRVKRAARSHSNKVPLSPSRRHAANSLIFTRSAKPGCKCPKPGKPDGDKEFEISQDCFNSVNDLLHLFVHILGLDHQHNMHDRDEYLHIVWDNLTPEVRNEMQKKLPPAAAAGFYYDYQSVTHYPWLEIKNGVTNVMYPIWNDGWAMGHWQGLSSTDVQKINLIYAKQCAKRKDYAEGKS